MCLHVSVAILSGQSVFVEMEPGSSVEDLRKAAESQLQTSLGILVQPGGAEFLRGTSTLQDAGIQDGDVVGAFMAKPKLQLHANRLSHAICAIQKDGSVIAWGDEDSGGDSSDVQDELVNVWDVKMTARACAALRRDGTVVSWGCEDLGGDSDAVQEELQNVQKIFSTAGAFAAIRADGAVITWGDEDWGGDCTEVHEDLKNVVHICGSGAAFAALTAHGSVITWGSACHGGDSRSVSAQLQDVQSMCATSAAFAAITGSGDVVVWGDPLFGGDASKVAAELVGVRSLQATAGAFAAVKSDGSVVCWGLPELGGSATDLTSRIQHAKAIIPSGSAFAAITKEGEVICWGDPERGGDIAAVREQLVNVEEVAATENAFAAIKEDGSVVSWGQSDAGGDSRDVQERLLMVKQIVGSTGAFAALTAAGQLVTWGHESFGGVPVAALIGSRVLGRCLLFYAHEAPTPVGTDLGTVVTPAPMEDSTPSPERELATARLTGEKEFLDSPNPATAHRSVQNTPEPTHYHYGSFGGGAGAPISTPSPCAMSALNNQHFLGMPRFPADGGLVMPGVDLCDALGPVLPPPLPTPGGTGPASDIGMGFGGAFRPGAEAAAEGDRSHAVEAKPMAPAELPTFWQLRTQDQQIVHQMAAAAAGYQAYQWGAVAAAAALGGLQSAGWRVPGCPGGCMDIQAHLHQSAQAKVGVPPVFTKDGGGAALAPGPVYPSGPSVQRSPVNNDKLPEEHAPATAEPHKGRGRGEVDAAPANGKGGKGRGPNGAARGRFDAAALPAEAAELLGQVGQLSRSQAGSKYLQRQLQKGPGAIMDVILAEVEDEIAGMMCDSYGNYLCSAAFQACSPRQRKRILEKLSPQVGAIACDKRGTHALQALIGLLQLEEEQQLLMNAIKSRVIELSMDPNGTHVVQRLLCCFLPSVTEWIYIAINDRMIEVAHHPYGLCVLKKCISQAKPASKHQDMLLKQLARHAMDLVQSPYGNYAIQHALEEWGGNCCQPILHKLEGRMMQLSIQKFSSNVVEKLFCSAPADFRDRFIAELVESEKMSVLVNSDSSSASPIPIHDLCQASQYFCKRPAV
ncbi:unnamed protein product [Symbiodinium microadriaticum]|nr:unnamed protein product [Symbiodinium microadriaticum]